MLPHIKVALESRLEEDFLPHLPPVIKPKGTPEEQRKKDLSRAFAAFVIHARFGVEPPKACSFVVDDDDDHGIDAFYFESKGEHKTLYLIQTKLKAEGGIKEEDMQKFLVGVFEWMDGKFEGFNKHVQLKKTDIEAHLEDATRVSTILAFVEGTVGVNANRAFKQLVEQKSESDARLTLQYEDLDSDWITDYLVSAQAYTKVDADLFFAKAFKTSDDPEMVAGLVSITQLTELHQKHGLGLFTKNVRQFLGSKSSIGPDIERTLRERPGEFHFLNNGITIIAKTIQQGQGKDGKVKWKLKDISVVNGAQTISTCAHFSSANPDVDIDAAAVMVSVIKYESDDDLGRRVTIARNTQNPVKYTDFLAVDPKQEEIRRIFKLLKIEYRYQSGEYPETKLPIIGSHELAIALCLSKQYFLAAWAATNNLDNFSNTSHWTYQFAFNKDIDCFQAINAVRIWRYICQKMDSEMYRHWYVEKRFYKYSRYTLAWIFFASLNNTLQKPRLLDYKNLDTTLSNSFDLLRNELLSTYRITTYRESEYSYHPGPLKYFKTMDTIFSAIKKTCVKHWGLEEDPVLENLWGMRVDDKGQERFFNYLASKAPQIDL